MDECTAVAKRSHSLPARLAQLRQFVQLMLQAGPHADWPDDAAEAESDERKSYRQFLSDLSTSTRRSLEELGRYGAAERRFARAEIDASRLVLEAARSDRLRQLPVLQIQSLAVPAQSGDREALAYWHNVVLPVLRRACPEYLLDSEQHGDSALREFLVVCDILTDALMAKTQPASFPQGGAPSRHYLSRDQVTLSWLASAMILVMKHPDWSDRRIAQEVRKNRSTLSRNVAYKRAAKLARSNQRRLPRGRVVKNRDTGDLDLEATSEPDCRESDVE
jgi:hypothetical protein